MDYIKIGMAIINLIIIGLLLYAWIVVIPEQTKLFKDCKEKILCENKILKGEVCDKYEVKGYFNLTTGTGTTSTTA